MNIFIITFILFFIFIIILKFTERKSNLFDIYFGVPGSGKTTQASKIAQKYIEKGINVYSNVPIDGCYIIEKQDIGVFDMSDSLLLYDEVGIDFNNRNFKDNINKDMLYLFKFHRHYNLDIIIFSQSYDDMDITLKRLATKYYLMVKSFFPYLFVRKSILKFIGINQDTENIQDSFRFVPFSLKYTFGPFYWKYFNSYDRKLLPKKEFKKW
jgi:hypothetical protein